MFHIFSILVNNEPGVLIRIASLFSRRNFNIDSLAVGTTNDPAISRITITLHADFNRAEQIRAHLLKSPVVIAVDILDPDKAVARGIALFKIPTNDSNRHNILDIANAFRARIVHCHPNSIILEFTGSQHKINAAHDALSHFGIAELIQSGIVALNRDLPLTPSCNPSFSHKNLF